MSISPATDGHSFDIGPDRDRVDARGAVVGGLAHNLGNLFSSALLAAPLLREDPGGQRAAGLLSSLESAMERGIELVEEIKLYLGHESRHGEADVRLKYLVEGIAKIARDRVDEQCVFETSYSPELPRVTIEPFLLFDLLNELTEHAVNGAAPGSKIALAVADTVAAGGSEETAGSRAVEITLLHDNHQLDEAQMRRREKLEERIETISRQLSCRVVRVETPVRSGWKVVLSAARPSETDSIPEPHHVDSAKNGELLLLVDDDETFARTASETLRGYGYRVLTANSGVEAIQVYEQRGSEIDLVITDLAMAGMTGLSTIRHLKELNPEVGIIVVTGVMALERRARQMGEAVRQLVRKPLGPEDLLRAVEVGLREAQEPQLSMSLTSP